MQADIPGLLNVMLSEAKHLTIPTDCEIEILRLDLRMALRPASPWIERRYDLSDAAPSRRHAAGGSGSFRAEERSAVQDSLLKLLKVEINRRSYEERNELRDD
jgi:hypothetical protein